MAPGSNQTELPKKLWLWQLLRRRQAAEPEHTSAPGRHRFLSAAKDLDLNTLEDLMNRRLRMILRNTGLVVTFATLLIIGLTAFGIYMTATPTMLKIAVGPPGSEDVRFVEKLAEKFNRQKAAFRLTPVVTDDPVDMMDSDEIPDYDLAVVASNPAMSPDWPVVTILRQNVMLLLVPAPGTRGPIKDKRAKVPTITKVADLAGTRVGIVGRSAANPQLLQVVLNHYGIPADKVQTQTIDPANLKTAIRDRTVDAILVAGPAGGQVIADTIAAASDPKRGPTFVPIDQAAAIAARVPAYAKFEIVTGAFGGSPPRPAEEIETLSFPEYLVASKSLSDVKIAALSKLIYTSRQAINFEMPGVIKIETPSTDKDAAVLVHPGTDAYLTDNQKTFFDRWGDQIFYGLLIFPILGSAIAGMVGYLRGEKGNQRVRLLHRLLQLMKRARAAESIEALDQIQVEVDHILVTMIQQVERNQLDETGLMLFSTVIEQAHHAIADRRGVLVNQPQKPPQPAVVQTLPTPQQVVNR